MSNVLFITTSSSGDVIHYMPAITEARRHHLLTQKMIEFRRVNGQTPTGLLRTRSGCWFAPSRVPRRMYYRRTLQAVQSMRSAGPHWSLNPPRVAIYSSGPPERAFTFTVTVD